MAVLLVAGFALLVGCSKPEIDVISFSAQVQPILTEHCAQCHVTGDASAGLALEAGSSYQNLVGAPSGQSELMLVEPGDPERSYLIHKLEGTQMEVGGYGTRMPMGDENPLPAATIDVIGEWIAQGAKDN